jgi:hypothetical protein
MPSTGLSLDAAQCTCIDVISARVPPAIHNPSCRTMWHQPTALSIRCDLRPALHYTLLLLCRPSADFLAAADIIHWHVRKLHRVRDAPRQLLLAVRRVVKRPGDVLPWAIPLQDLLCPHQHHRWPGDSSRVHRSQGSPTTRLATARPVPLAGIYMCWLLAARHVPARLGHIQQSPGAAAARPRHEPVYRNAARQLGRPCESGQSDLE